MCKKFIYHILFFISLLQSNIYPVIFESHNLSDIYKYLDKDSIVVTDIDNTIVKTIPKEVEPWIKYKTLELRKKGLSYKEALNHALYMFMIISKLTKLVPLGNSPKIIHDLQKKNIPIIALTNRSIPVVKRTIKQLKNIGIDLSKNNLYKNDIDLQVTHNGKYSHGIIFTGSNDKGKMLYEFFKKIKKTPKKIIFVNDKIKNVKSVEKAAIQNNAEFIGIRLCLMDKEKKDFDPVAAKKQILKLETKLGFHPLTKTEQVEQETPTTSWLRSIWNTITWPFKKIWKLFN